MIYNHTDNMCNMCVILLSTNFKRHFVSNATNSHLGNSPKVDFTWIPKQVFAMASLLKEVYSNFTFKQHEINSSFVSDKLKMTTIKNWKILAVKNRSVSQKNTFIPNDFKVSCVEKGNVQIR